MSTHNSNYVPHGGALSGFFPFDFYLSLRESFHDLTFAVVILNFGYHLLRATTDKSPKRSSWILTFLCSGIGIIGCFYTLFNFALNKWDLSTIYSTNRESRFFITFFCTFFVLDLVYLNFHYPEESGWAHHIAYFLCMVLGLLYNFPMVYVVFFPLEIPTFILSIGHIWPKYRQDILFGVIFFLTRVLFHGFMLRILYDTRYISPLPVWHLASISWLIHVFWFGKWCISYNKKFRKISKS